MVEALLNPFAPRTCPAVASLCAGMAAATPPSLKGPHLRATATPPTAAAAVLVAAALALAERDAMKRNAPDPPQPRALKDACITGDCDRALLLCYPKEQLRHHRWGWGGFLFGGLQVFVGGGREIGRRCLRKGTGGYCCCGGGR